MKLLVMWSSLLTCYLVSLVPKYFPQHPNLEHRQDNLLSESVRPRFTPVQNIRQSYVSV